MLMTLKPTVSMKLFVLRLYRGVFEGNKVSKREKKTIYILELEEFGTVSFGSSEWC